MRISRLGSSRNIARGAYRVTRFALDAENELPVYAPSFSQQRRRCAREPRPEGRRCQFKA
jgi:hypothetical protein